MRQQKPQVAWTLWALALGGVCLTILLLHPPTTTIDKVKEYLTAAPSAVAWWPSTAILTAQIPGWAAVRAGQQYSQLRDYEGDPMANYDKFHSQSGEDKWMHDNIFYHKQGGFFLELGALDGVRLTGAALSQAEIYSFLVPKDACSLFCQILNGSRKHWTGVGC